MEITNINEFVSDFIFQLKNNYSEENIKNTLLNIIQRIAELVILIPLWLKKKKVSHTMKQSQCSKSADFMLIKEAAGIRDG